MVYTMLESVNHSGVHSLPVEYWLWACRCVEGQPCCLGGWVLDAGIPCSSLLCLIYSLKANSTSYVYSVSLFCFPFFPADWWNGTWAWEEDGNWLIERTSDPQKHSSDTYTSMRDQIKDKDFRSLQASSQVFVKLDLEIWTCNKFPPSITCQSHYGNHFLVPRTELRWCNSEDNRQYYMVMEKAKYRSASLC